MIINANDGNKSLEIFSNIEPKYLKDKIILDLSLPLEFHADMPSSVSLKDGKSLGERLQILLSQSFVVKTLNTMPNSLMIDPKGLGKAHHTFISGDSSEAKERVLGLLGEFGWDRKSVIDLGGIVSARTSELYANMIFDIAKAIGTYEFNIAIVKR